MTTETRTYEVESILIRPGGYGGGLAVSVVQPSAYVILETLELRDATISLEGRDVPDEELFRFVRSHRSVEVQLDRDPERYGKVRAARFTAGGGE
jgi:hypothetical protein